MQATHKRQNLHREPSLSAQVENRRTVFGRATRDGKNNLLDAFEARNFFDIACTACDKHIMEILANLVAVIIDQANRVNIERFGSANGTMFFGGLQALNFFEQNACSLARANNHGTDHFTFTEARIHKGDKRPLEQVAEHAHTNYGHHSGHNGKAYVQTTLDDVKKPCRDDKSTKDALDAAQIITHVKIAPQLIVRAKKEEACKARKSAKYQERNQDSPIDTVCKHGQRDIDDEPRHKDDERVYQSKQALAKSKVDKQLFVVNHNSTPT